MNVLIDIGHPAHVHLFKNLIRRLKQDGNKVVVLTKSVPVIIELLRAYNIDFIELGKKSNSLSGKYLKQFYYVWKTAMVARKNKIDLALGVSMTLPLAAKIFKFKVIGLDDDDSTITPVFAKFVNKSDIVLTPSALAHEDRGPNHMTHNSYHELAYLHPDEFVPDPSVLKEMDVETGEKYSFLRFNSFNAHHDTGAKGMNDDQKQKLINKLSEFGKVFVSYENEDEERANSITLNCSAQKIHSAIYYSALFAGDSQTMTSEAAVLGVTAFKCNSFAGQLSIPNELEQKYNLCFSYRPEQFCEMLEKIDLVMKSEFSGVDFHKQRNFMISEKGNLTNILYELIRKQKL